MSRIDDIMQKYLTADDETRLHIYLQHPPLRDDFIRIDLGKKPKPGKAKGIQENLRGSFRNRWRAVMND